jgi:hypothetical protein
VTLRSALRFRPCSFHLWFRCCLLFICAGDCSSQAQETSVEGYITAVKIPGGFDVNGEHVTIRPETTYGVIGDKSGASASADGVQVGAFVRVSGAADAGNKGILASSVLFRDDGDKKLAGFGVVERVLVAGAEPVFQADGYRIRIDAKTDLSFGGSLKTLADVGPNTWLYYKGKRDADGVLVAARAKFVPARGWAWLASHPKTHPQQEPVPAQGALMDADGKMMSLRAKVRYGDSGGYCGWHKVSTDAALQERVLRIGQRLIPAYQKQLAQDDPAKIWFRFYVVEEDKIREDLECNSGLILMPAKGLERLQTDDQIAALLANGIAYSMQMQSAQLIAENRELLGVQLAADLARVGVLALVPDAVVEHAIEMRLQEERGRMALALMTDAGFDPWQAPEAWRRVAPKTLPKDWDTVKFPNRGGYQLGILNLQYSRGRAAAVSSIDGSGDSGFFG